MSDGEEALNGEILVTDVLLKVTKITEVERNIYELNLRNAKLLRQQIGAVVNPTSVEVMLLFRHVLNFGLSQKALATWFGVTPGSLSRWVTGEHPPRDFMRGPIVKELGEVVDYLIRRLEAYAKRPNFRRQPSNAQRGKVVHLR